MSLLSFSLTKLSIFLIIRMIIYCMCALLAFKPLINHRYCRHNLCVIRVHDTWPKYSYVNNRISLPCLSSIHSFSSISCLGADAFALNNLIWAQIFELYRAL